MVIAAAWLQSGTGEGVEDGDGSGESQKEQSDDVPRFADVGVIAQRDVKQVAMQTCNPPLKEKGVREGGGGLHDTNYEALLLSYWY